MTIAPFQPGTDTLAQPASSAPAADAPATGLQLTCKQEDLARALAAVSHAVLPHSTVPILKTILVSTDAGRLRLSATTLEIGIQVWIDAQISQPGTTALPSDLFTKMVSQLPSGNLSLTVAEGSQTLKMEGVGCRSNIRGADPREFPLIPGIEGDEARAAAITVEAGLLKKMIEQVAFAAESDTSKPIMACVKWQVAETKLTLAAADTFRLAERVAPLSGMSEAQQADILIPARNLAELAKVLPSSGPVQVMVTRGGQQVVFHAEQGERIDFVSRLVEGAFPNYKQLFKNLVETPVPTKIVVDTRSLVQAARRAALLAVDTKKTMRLTCNTQGDGALFGTIVVDADDADLGDHVSTLQAEVTGESQLIYFNVKYLGEALDHIDTPQVALLLYASGRPVLLKPVSDIEYTSLVQTQVIPQKATD